MAKKTPVKKSATKKSPAKKVAKKKSYEESSQGVNAFLKDLNHPLEKEIEEVRYVILKSDQSIRERVKWNAPSFYASEDLVTFHVRPQDHVHLVFHHPAIVKIESDLLEGDYKDRRMTYFKDMKEIKAKSKELTRIMKELVILAAQ